MKADYVLGEVDRILRRCNSLLIEIELNPDSDTPKRELRDTINQWKNLLDCYVSQGKELTPAQKFFVISQVQLLNDSLNGVYYGYSTQRAVQAEDNFDQFFLTKEEKEQWKPTTRAMGFIL